MKKSLALLLSIMILTTSVFASPLANTPNIMRASEYFDGYGINISPRGNNKMLVSFSIFGTDTMDKIGVYSLRVEEQVDINVWNEVFTVYGDDYSSDFYSYDMMDHDGTFSFNGYAGVKYRAVIVGYAEDSSGHEYSREIVSAGRVCK